MKFPLSESVFPTIRLTPNQCAEFEQLTESVLSDAIEEYNAFNNQQRRQLSKLQWKVVKKRDSITVYCERGVRSDATPQSAPSESPSALNSMTSGSGAAFDFTASGSALDFTESGRSRMVFDSPVSKTPSTPSIRLSASRQRKLPKLLAVGTVPGTVEDMVYGMSSPSPTHTMIKSAYTRDEILDAKVLHEIKSPTPEDPLRFLGLKWLVKGHSNTIGALVRPRDLVFVESIGIRTLPNGVRVGYFVMHSVEVPECRELTELSIVRARISSCYLFRQSTGPVDVFMKSYVELNGNVADVVALRTVANSLVSVAQAGVCAHSRKMGWAVTRILRDPARRSREAPTVTGDSNCSTCGKSFSRFASMYSCMFCSSLLCVKCRESRELTISSVATTTKTSRSAKCVALTTIDVCKRRCATRFRYQDAVEVARQEIIAGEYGSAPSAAVQPANEPSERTKFEISNADRAVSKKAPPAISAQGHRAKDGKSATAPPLPPAIGTAFVPRVSLEDISAHLLTLDAPVEHTSPNGSRRGSRVISNESAEDEVNDDDSDEDVPVNVLSTQDLEQLEELLLVPASGNPIPNSNSLLSASSSSSLTRTAAVGRELPMAAPVQPVSAARAAGSDGKEESDHLERKDSVIELKRDDGEWVQSVSSATSASSSSAVAVIAFGPGFSYGGERATEARKNDDLYQRITELHQTAEHLYQYTKRATEAALSTASIATGTSLLARLSFEDGNKEEYEHNVGHL